MLLVLFILYLLVSETQKSPRAQFNYIAIHIAMNLNSPKALILIEILLTHFRVAINKRRKLVCIDHNIFLFNMETFPSIKTSIVDDMTVPTAIFY